MPNNEDPGAMEYNLTLWEKTSIKFKNTFSNVVPNSKTAPTHSWDRDTKFKEITRHITGRRFSISNSTILKI